MAIPNTEFPFVEIPAYDVIQSGHEMGPVLRGARRTEEIRRFRLFWQLASRADKDDLVAEFRGVRGGAGTFSYTPADDASPVTVRFLEDSLSWRWVEPARYQMEITLEQELY